MACSSHTRVERGAALDGCRRINAPSPWFESLPCFKGAMLSLIARATAVPVQIQCMLSVPPVLRPALHVPPYVLELLQITTSVLALVSGLLVLVFVPTGTWGSDVGPDRTIFGELPSIWPACLTDAVCIICRIAVFRVGWSDRQSAAPSQMLQF